MRLRALAGTEFDLLVVGGGINGAGIALEAAQRGQRVALIEKLDYAAGTTSRSTRLIHGGLRYLEHGELLLVLESLRERERLLRHRPHLVRPLRFVIPIYSHSSRSARLIRAGMLLYDLLSAGKGLPNHRVAGRAQLSELERQLNAPGLKGAFLYYDGQLNFPERLVWETIAEAKLHGAVAVNHCELLEFRLEGRRVRGARVRDRLTGSEGEVRARLTVNVTGPWLEQLDALLPARRSRPLLAPTRGSHLVVGSFPSAPADALYFEAASDRRPVFVIPWNGLHLIGTTDVPFSGDPSRVVPSGDEVDYLLTEVNRILPRARLGRQSVLFSYAGVRALPFEEHVAPGELTRRHILFDHATRDGIEGLASVLGGKLTTYRALAKDVVDRLTGKPGAQQRARDSAAELPEFVAWPWHDPRHAGAGSREALLREAAPLAESYHLEPAEIVRLFETYGPAAHEVLRLIAEDQALATRLSPESSVLAAEVVHASRNEQASTIGDVLLRRTCAALGPDRGLRAATAVAGLLAGEHGWTREQKEQAPADYSEEIERTLPRQ